MKKNQLFEITVKMLERVQKEKMCNMHPFFHYIEIGGEGIGMNDWNIQSGITDGLKTKEKAFDFYNSIRQPYIEFAKKDLLLVCEQLNGYYNIDLTFFKSLWQAIYLFAAQGDNFEAKEVAEKLFLFFAWFKHEFSENIDFPASTPIFVGHAYPADIIDEHIEYFFDNLKLRLASFRYFFPGDIKYRFPSFRFPDKNVTLLNAALTGATRRHTEYVAKIGETDFYFRLRLGHTDCGNGFYLTFSYLPFGYKAKEYSRAMRKPDSSPDVFCKCGGDYSINGDFKIKNIQGGSQFKPGVPIETELAVREFFLKSKEFYSLIRKLEQAGIQVNLSGSISEESQFLPQDLNLFSVSRSQKSRTEKILMKWGKQETIFLRKYNIRVSSDEKLEQTLRDENDLTPEFIGYRLNKGDVFSYYKKNFGDISPFDIVLLKLINIIACADGFLINKSKRYNLCEIKIASANLNKWIGHSSGNKNSYKKIYDERAERFDFKKEEDWFKISINALSVEKILEGLVKKESEDVKNLVKVAVETNNFKIYHNSELLDVPRHNFNRL